MVGMTVSILPVTAPARADRLHLAGIYAAFGLIAAVTFGTLFAGLF